MNNRLLPTLPLTLQIVTLSFSTNVNAGCGDTWSPGSETTSSNCGSPGTLTKNVPQTIYWLDGYSRTTTVSDYGQAGQQNVITHACVRCWPGFYTPEWLNTGRLRQGCFHSESRLPKKL